MRCQSESERTQLFDRALHANAQAAALLNGQELPKARLLQRARLLRATGNHDEASRSQERADAAVVQSDFDRRLLAAELNLIHNYSATVELLEALLRDKPQDYASWFGLGSAHYRAGHYAKAEGCTRQIKYTPRIHAVVKR